MYLIRLGNVEKFDNQLTKNQCHKDNISKISTLHDWHRFC